MAGKPSSSSPISSSTTSGFIGYNSSSLFSSPSSFTFPNPSSSLSPSNRSSDPTLFGQSPSFSFSDPLLFGIPPSHISSRMNPFPSSSTTENSTESHLEELVDNVPVTDLELNSDDGNKSDSSAPVSEQRDVVAIPSSCSEQESQNVVPLEIVSVSLQSLFSVQVKNHVRQAVISSVKTLAETISKAQSSENPASVKSEILEDLEALKHMAKAAKINDLSLSWIISKVDEFVEFADVVAKLEDATDTTSLVSVCADLSLCKSSLASDETRLSQLQDSYMDMKQRDKILLAMRAAFKKLEKDFAIEKEDLKNSRTEVENRIELNKAKKRDLEELEKTCKANLEELNLKRVKLEDIAEAMISFASSA